MIQAGIILHLIGLLGSLNRLGSGLQPTTGQAKASAEHVEVRLTKEPSGFIRLSVHNVGGGQIAVRRYTDRRYQCKFEVESSSGRYLPVHPLWRNFHAYPAEERTTDWTLLGDEDEVSWVLIFNDTSNLKRGDKVRITWKPAKLPKEFAKDYKPFPARTLTVLTTVG